MLRVSAAFMCVQLTARCWPGPKAHTPHVHTQASPSSRHKKASPLLHAAAVLATDLQKCHIQRTPEPKVQCCSVALLVPLSARHQHLRSAATDVRAKDLVSFSLGICYASRARALRWASAVVSSVSPLAKATTTVCSVVAASRTVRPQSSYLP